MKVIVSKAQFPIFPILVFCQTGPSMRPTIYEDPGGPLTGLETILYSRPSVIFINFLEVL